MNKTMNKLVMILAAGMMFAGAANAGTTGCFQFVKGHTTSDFQTLNPIFFLTDVNVADGVVNVAVDLPNSPVKLYNGSDCTGFFDGANAAENLIAGQDAVQIAYELTSSYPIDLSNVNGGGADDTVMYVSTTAIPGASRLTFTLTNATWDDSIMYLLKWNNELDGGSWSQVAATDGQVVGESGAVFLFQSGITVQAGTKLMLSKNAGSGTGATASFVPPSFTIANSTCGTPTNVTLNVSTALTDGGSTIIGAATTKGTQSNILINTPLQFVITPPALPTSAEVDVEPPSLRTNFVLDDSGSDDADLIYSPDRAASFFTTAPIIYTNLEAQNVLNYDDHVVLAAADHVVTKVFADKSVEAFMTVGLYDLTQFTNIAPDVEDTLAVANAATGSLGMTIGSSLATSTAYEVDADELFHATTDGTTNLATANTVYAVLATTDTTQVMPYNYNVSMTQYIDFANENYLDSCIIPSKLFSIGINGAVFKVPYIYNNASTFLRVSNEDTSTALIFGDFFEGGLECTNVDLGTIGSKASNLLFAADMVKAIKAAGSADNDCDALATAIPVSNSNRFFGTFTVTSPKDKVHAYGIQKPNTAGAQERALIILDQNSWAQ